MRVLISLPLALLLLHTTAECREYHYDKPQIPFITGAVEESYAHPQPSTPHYRTQSSAPSVIRTQNGQAFEVSMAGSQQIYQGRLTAAATTTAQQATPSSRAYPPPAVVSYSGAVQAQHGQQTTGYNSGQYAAAYTGESAARGIPYGGASHNNQYSSHTNPLLTTQYAPQSSHSATSPQGATFSGNSQTSAAYYPPNAQGSSYQGFSQSGGYSGQSSQPATVYQRAPNNARDSYSGTTYAQASQSAHGYQETAPNYQAGSGGYQAYAGNSGSSQTGASYYPGTAQSGGTQSGGYHVDASYPGQNGAAYSQGAPLTGQASYTAGTSHAGSIAAQYQPAAYGQGQQSQSGGSNAGANGQFGEADLLNGIIGDYVSQSEGSQLDGYPYKQQSSGEARPFKRIITTCYPGGQCQRQELAAGQADGRHQHFVMAARARISPVSDKCRRNAETKAYGGGASDVFGLTSSVQSSQTVAPAPLNQPNNRPQNRRLFEYSEVVQRDPFN